MDERNLRSGGLDHQEERHNSTESGSKHEGIGAKPDYRVANPFIYSENMDNQGSSRRVLAHLDADFAAVIQEAV